MSDWLFFCFEFFARKEQPIRYTARISVQLRHQYGIFRSTSDLSRQRRIEPVCSAQFFKDLNWFFRFTVEEQARCAEREDSLVLWSRAGVPVRNCSRGVELLRSFWSTKFRQVSICQSVYISCVQQNKGFLIVENISFRTASNRLPKFTFVRLKCVRTYVGAIFRLSVLSMAFFLN